jgi:hypothetical protein
MAYSLITSLLSPNNHIKQVFENQDQKTRRALHQLSTSSSRSLLNSFISPG